VPAAQLSISGTLSWYDSSPHAKRGFCPVCGCYLFWDEGNGEIWISLGSVDGPTGTRLENHIFCAYKGDYYDLSDPLPHHRTGWSSKRIDDPMSFSIAIDGPAAAGKGTISKAVAQHYGFAHLDTGLLYRAVGAKTLLGIDAVKAAQTLAPEDLEQDNLRTPEVAQAASKVAVIADVRAALVDFQRAFARRAGGAVLDGRDIGTVICPNAEAKLFVTASAEVRAERRYKELTGKGLETSFAEVLADVVARDERDMNRTEAPLKPASDAVIIDTSALDIDQAVATAISAIDSKRKSA
jgi:cytidylate kinase